jgi:mono/diheme cytochrome c family protein|tara:strand:- start:1922 stop:2695 length:774 start_codon:yes stop_codon:yes gene_type:complete
LSDFQELLHEEGYENVLIIGIGKDFLQDDFGEAFCQNSTLPLILDSSTDYINYVIQQQFDAQHKEVVILGTDGSILDRFVMPFNSIEPYEQQIYDTIVENYSSTSAESVDYSTQIQPIFNSSCTNCHGGDGGINLSSYDNVMNGGNSGDAVIPYDHSNSLLWQYVNSGFMPLGDNDLTDTQVNLIARWIDEGALSEPYEPLAGDVNDDGAVNILDIVQLANMILSDEYQGSGDLNDDGMLNILDIVQLVNIILRKTG